MSVDYFWKCLQKKVFKERFMGSCCDSNYGVWRNTKRVGRQAKISKRKTKNIQMS